MYTLLDYRKNAKAEEEKKDADDEVDPSKVSVSRRTI